MEGVWDKYYELSSGCRKGGGWEKITPRGDGGGKNMNADEILILVIIILVSICFVGLLIRYNLKPIVRPKLEVPVKIAGIVVVGLISTYLSRNLENIQLSDWILIALYTGLIGITLVYAVGSHRQWYHQRENSQNGF